MKLNYEEILERLKKIRQLNGHQNANIVLMVHTISATNWREALCIKERIDLEFGDRTMSVIACPFMDVEWAIGFATAI